MEEIAMDNFLRLFDVIGELARRRHQAAERCFARLGLNHTEARLLTLLNQAGGSATQDALSNSIFLDRSNAGRALNRLEHAGHVERRKDEVDKRTNLVQITDKGQATVAEIATLRQAMARQFFGDLTDDEAGAIADLLGNALASDRHV
jgi:DNA-binding MarR family transcriptional regulator